MHSWQRLSPALQDSSSLHCLFPQLGRAFQFYGISLASCWPQFLDKLGPEESSSLHLHPMSMFLLVISMLQVSQLSLWTMWNQLLYKLINKGLISSFFKGQPVSPAPSVEDAFISLVFIFGILFKYYISDDCSLVYSYLAVHFGHPIVPLVSMSIFASVPFSS